MLSTVVVLMLLIDLAVVDGSGLFIDVIDVHVLISLWCWSES
jgi:hypothetical protein